MEASIRKPIKRSKELGPLSRDHHDALLLCWKIRSGMKANVETQRIAVYTLSFFETELKGHFEQEEAFLFSLLKQEDALAAKAIQQHQAIRQQFALLKQSPDDTGLLKSIADDVEAHIRFEERTLFNHIEQEADPLKLKSAGEALATFNEQHCKHTWNDEFWVTKK